MRAAVWVVCLVGWGCGAKSGLDTAAPDARPGPVDAGRVEAGARDAGFDTFPCRWSLTARALIATYPSDTPLRDPRGAVHAERDEILALAAVPSRGTLEGARLALGDPPSPFSTERLTGGGDFMGAGSAWAQLTGDCRHVVYGNGVSDALVNVGEVPIRPATTCALEADLGRFVVTVTGEGGAAVVTHPPGDVSAEERADYGVSPAYARSVRAGGRELLLALAGDRLLALGRPSWGASRVELGRQREPFDVAPDGFRPAAVVLRRDPAGAWLLERVRMDGAEPRAEALQSLEGLTPEGSLVTNETEALFPLRDGRVAVAPLSGSPLRFIDVPHEGMPAGTRVVLRPGRSTGGVVTVDATGREYWLSFFGLTCNR